MADKPDDFAAYFTSEQHKSRQGDAINRAVERLSGIGKGDLLASFSEAIGTIYGVGHYYRTLGLKHQGASIFREVFKWMKSGTD